MSPRQRTEFHGVPTHTSVGIGPDRAERIDAVTGELKLY
jgi:peptidyl-tRNA hydrolase